MRRRRIGRRDVGESSGRAKVRRRIKKKEAE